MNSAYLKEKVLKEEQTRAFARDTDELLTGTYARVLGYSVAVVKGGKLVLERSGGFRRIDPLRPENNLPVTSDTRFRIASVSKIFTAIAIMQLSEAGMLDIDADISLYLGFPLRNPYYPNKIITARQLMSHTSSIRNGSAYVFPSSVHIRESLVPGGSLFRDGEHFAAPEDGKDRAPGSYFTYSNMNFSILGTVVERLSGERFDRYMRVHVLHPMGIAASFNVGDFSEKELKNISVLYRCAGPGLDGPENPWVPKAEDFSGWFPDKNRIPIQSPNKGDSFSWDDVSNYIPGTNATVFHPQGGLRITARELSQAIVMFLREGVAENGNRILSRQAVCEMRKPVWARTDGVDNCDRTLHQHAFGTGLNIISTELGGDHVIADAEDITLYGHTGLAYGLHSACYFDPVRNCGFAYAFSGVCAKDEEAEHGKYSQRNIWHERMMTAIWNNLLGY